VKAIVKLEKLSGSRASFATQCLLLPTPPEEDNYVDSPTVLLEGQALALLKDLKQ
jgi:hypothetical protein